MQIIFKMTATNNEIDKIEMTVNPNNEAMEIESFEKLTKRTAQKKFSRNIRIRRRARRH